KKLNAKNIVRQDINYEKIEKIEEIGNEYSEKFFNKRLQELVGIWKINVNTVEEVNKQFQLFEVCSRNKPNSENKISDS
ncbi:9212_t:CDS:2, partial [Dentiscutata heterogama]